MEDVTMPVFIGINGFGHLGRMIFFLSLTDPLVNVVAINDASMSIDYITYIVQNEGSLSPEDRASVKVVGENLCLQRSRQIRVTNKHDLVDIAWRDVKVDYVVECSGFISTRERCWGHVAGGAKGVVIAGQSADAPTVIVGANDTEIKRSYPVVCAGTPIAVALTPIIRLLHEHYGVEECSYTAIHGMRAVEPTAGRSKNVQDWRQTRTALDTIVPYSNTGSKTIEKVLPALVDRVSGSAFQVPVTKGCAIDMLVQLAQSVSKEVLDDALNAAASGRLNEVLLYSKSDLISRDCMSDGKIYYDATSSMSLCNGKSHKLLLWFDLDASYARRILSLIVFLHKMGTCGEM